MTAESMCTIPNPHAKANPFVVVSLSIVTPLKTLNYITWESQVESILKGFDLFQYPNGTLPTPPETIQTGSPATTVKNPAFLSWKRQDKVVYGTILPTLSESVASLVTQTQTSAELWATLKKTFACASRGHKKQLKDRFRSIVKGNSTLSEYMNNVKAVVDLLASISAAVPEEDVTDQVLRGLDDSFQFVVDGVHILSSSSPIFSVAAVWLSN